MSRHRATIDPSTQREELRHVYWIGGGSGAGKSVTARLLADLHGLGVYSTDDAMSDHANRTTPGDSPCLAEFKAMDMDQRWIRRSPATMLDTFHWFRGEAFGLIIDDLLGFPDRPVVAEGLRLLPHLVKPLLAETHHAVWLLPTPEFRRAAFESRGGLWAIAAKTSDPDTALHNLLERDRMFTDRLRNETRRLGLRTIEVDLATTEEDLAEQVADALQL